MNTSQTQKKHKNNQYIDLDKALEISNLLQQKIKDNLQQLSLDSLKTIYDFSAYLAYKENQEATQEIEKIPNIEQKLQEAELDLIEGNLVDWNDLKDEL